MHCENCGAELSAQSNFCPYCGSSLQTALTPSISLINKAVSVANEANEYNLALISRGSLDAVTAGDLLEDVFGYTDAESAKLVKMAPVVIGENLTAEEASTVAQLYTEYGMQVSVTNSKDRFVDLSDKATSSIFDKNGKLLAGAAAVIGALTVANRISSYRRYKKPTILERLFRINYTPDPPAYQRHFRMPIDPVPTKPRRTIRRPEPEPRRSTPNQNMQRKPMDRARESSSGRGGSRNRGHGGPHR